MMKQAGIIGYLSLVIMMIPSSSNNFEQKQTTAKFKARSFPGYNNFYLLLLGIMGLHV